MKMIDRIETCIDAIRKYVTFLPSILLSFLDSQWLNVRYWPSTHNPVQVDLKSMKS